MTHQLETDLRAALAARAADIPDAAGDRLRAHDYRPRTRAVRPPVAAGALVAAVATVAAVSFVDLGASTPEAFAGWTANPTAAGGAQTGAAIASCRQRLAAMPNSAAAANVGKVTGRPMNLPPIDSLSPVLTDTRGPFTFLVFSRLNANATCISGPGFTSMSESASVGPAPTVPADGVAVTWAAHAAHAGHAYSFLEGHTGADVSAVTLNLTDGSAVKASSQNGWFVAWWPSSASARTATVTTPQGMTSAALPPAVAAGCPSAPAGASVSCAGAQAGRRGAAFGAVAQGGSQP